MISWQPVKAGGQTTCVRRLGARIVPRTRVERIADETIGITTDTGLAPVGFIETQLRLKTLQIRLAEMHDQLDCLSGKEPEDNLIIELTDF